MAQPRRFVSRRPRTSDSGSRDTSSDASRPTELTSSQLTVIKDDEAGSNYQRRYIFSQVLPKSASQRLVAQMRTVSTTKSVELSADSTVLVVELRYRERFDVFHSAKYDQIVRDELSPIEIDFITMRHWKRLQHAS